jgi:hypothetical protein
VVTTVGLEQSEQAGAAQDVQAIVLVPQVVAVPHELQFVL